MIGWLLLTLAFGYIIAMEPHLLMWRHGLRDGSFVGELTKCLPCACAWPGAFLGAAYMPTEILPPWFLETAPWWLSSAAVPVACFFAGMAVGFVVEALSPMKAAVFLKYAER